MYSTVEHFKNELSRHTYKMYVDLSPGTRIKAQLDYPQFREDTSLLGEQDDEATKEKSINSLRPKKEEDLFAKPRRAGSPDKSQVLLSNEEMAGYLRFVRKEKG
jgi:hypothetical protein